LHDKHWWKENKEDSHIEMETNKQHYREHHNDEGKDTQRVGTADKLGSSVAEQPADTPREKGHQE